MLRDSDHVTRRQLLRTVGAAGALGAVGSGVAAGSEDDRYIVGTSTRRGRDEARNRAESVRHVMSFGAAGWAVAGRYSEEARRNLRRRNDVRYVEEDREMQAIGHGTDEDSGDPTQEQVLPWGIDRVNADVAHHEDGYTDRKSVV